METRYFQAISRRAVKNFVSTQSVGTRDMLPKPVWATGPGDPVLSMRSLLAGKIRGGIVKTIRSHIQRFRWNDALFSLARRNLTTIVFVSVAAMSGCSQVPQQELQAAVDPFKDKNYPLAVERLSQLLERYPESARINYYLAFAYLTLDYKLALYFVNQTLSLQKRYESVIGDVKMANFLAGNSQNAKDLYFRLATLELQKIMSLRPETETSDRIQYHLAHYHLWKRDYSGAVAAFEKVVATPPDDTEYDLKSRLMIGDIYLRHLDNEKEGMKVYQSLIDAYPGTETAAEALFQVAEYNNAAKLVFEKRRQALQE
ncbi:MAG: tol-pal system YbgF family protein, partial [Nitrospinales bacterium]